MVLRSCDIRPTLPSVKWLHRTLRTNHETHFGYSWASIRRPDGLVLRATPIDSHLPSPAELLYGRRVVSNLPVATLNASGKRCEMRARLDQRQVTAKERHDARGVTDLAESSLGDHVRTRHPVTHRFEPGRIAEKCLQPLSYKVESSSGSVLRRNRRDIRETAEKHVFLSRNTCLSAPTMIGSLTSVRRLLMTMRMNNPAQPEANHCRTTYEILDCGASRAKCDSCFCRASARTRWFAYYQRHC